MKDPFEKTSSEALARDPARESITPRYMDVAGELERLWDDFDKQTPNDAQKLIATELRALRLLLLEQGQKEVLGRP